LSFGGERLRGIVIGYRDGVGSEEVRNSGGWRVGGGREDGRVEGESVQAKFDTRSNQKHEGRRPREGR